MNTIVFVLVVSIYNGHAPTVEFKTKEKCEAAIVAINKVIKEDYWSTSMVARCVRIEK